MRTLKLAGVLMCGALGMAATASAQTSRVFVDAAIMGDHDPTEFFYGTEDGVAGRAAIGARFSDRHGVRFEVDVPRWRVNDTRRSGLMYCAEASDCVTKNAYVPSRSTSHVEARSVSYALLYSLQFRESGRVRVSLVAGGALEQRGFRAADTWDELGANGEVLRHHESERARTNNWPAIVMGIDAEVRVTSHLAVTPQFRYHYFPYPRVKILRPGVALRWSF